jgi:hypothetical protein
MKSKQFSDAAILLHGPDWLGPLSEDLDTSKRTSTFPVN